MPWKSVMRQGCFLSYHHMESFIASIARQERVKGMKIGKWEIKLLLFVENMIAYIKQADLCTIRTMK